MNPTPLFTGAAIGALGMFLADPDRGPDRRSLVRDRWRRTRVDLFRQVGVTADGIQHDDRAVVQRVLTLASPFLSDPGCLEVEAEDGQVTLRGPVALHEVEPILHAAWNAKGVTEVINELDVHASTGRSAASRLGRILLVMTLVVATGAGALAWTGWRR